jgi:hypothetical protein
MLLSSLERKLRRGFLPGGRVRESQLHRRGHRYPASSPPPIEQPRCPASRTKGDRIYNSAWQLGGGNSEGPWPTKPLAIIALTSYAVRRDPLPGQCEQRVPRVAWRLTYLPPPPHVPLLAARPRAAIGRGAGIGALARGAGFTDGGISHEARHDNCRLT